MEETTSESLPAGEAVQLETLRVVQAMQNELSALREEVQMLRTELQKTTLAKHGQGSPGRRNSGHAVSLPPPLPPPTTNVALKRQATTKLGSKSAQTRDPFFAASLGRKFPMYVVPVATLLAPSFGRFRSHEELKASGALVEYREGETGGGKVLFCSHTWLRRAHPDNASNDKFALLRSVLQLVVEGRLHIKPHWMGELIWKKEARRFRIGATDLRRDLANGYVFFDFMSIPQADPEGQKAAIASLVSYVSTSSYFMCLAGSSWVHEDGSLRDELAWSGRGWCRMEMTSNVLSPSAKPLIIARSPSSIEAYPPAGHIGRNFLLSCVGKGAFTEESDKAKLTPFLRDLIAARKALAFSDGELTMARFLHASTDTLLQGCMTEEEEGGPSRETLAEWMATMRFVTPTDHVKGSGHSPLMFAIIAQRLDLVQALVERGAPIHATVRMAEPVMGLAAGNTMIAIALAGDQGERSAGIVRFLLQQGADPRQPNDKFGDHAMHIAMASGCITGVSTLMAHDPTLADLRSGINELPSVFACIFGHPKLVTFIKENYPDRFQAMIDTPVNDVGITMLTAAITNGAAHPDTLNLLLDAGVPIDGYAAAARGKFGGIVKACDLVARLRPFRKLPSIVVNFSYLSRTTALHAAAYFGSVGTVDLLLSRNAAVNSTANPKGATPLHFAAIGGHVEVCQALLRAGASVEVADKKGRTPIAWATRLDHEAVRRLLLSWGHVVEPSAPLEVADSLGSLTSVASQIDTDVEVVVEEMSMSPI